MMNATIGSIKSIRKGRNSMTVKIIFKAVFVDGFGDVKFPVQVHDVEVTLSPTFLRAKNS